VLTGLVYRRLLEKDRHSSPFRPMCEWRPHTSASSHHFCRADLGVTELVNMKEIDSIQ
jgi:hypothetical protein